MATVSSHTLNSVDGSHAGGIVAHLYRLDPGGARTTLFASATDAGGRLVEEVTVTAADQDVQYELVLQTGAYFAARESIDVEPRICREVVIRFGMPDPEGRYHIPMMLAPNSYSVWWSA